MPEGDTVHTLARLLEPELKGRRLERVEIEREPARFLEKLRVQAVRAVGKHLLFDIGELRLRTHLGLHGSWHRYRPEERWRRPARQASLLLGTEEALFICFNAREIACFDRDREKFHRRLQCVGPDLLAERLELDEIVKRVRAKGLERPIADTLLDQSIASGIGNVYKSEVLFLTGIHPRTPVGELSDDRLAAIYECAAELMRANVGPGPRVTTDRRAKEKLWVYRRAGRPCSKCGTSLAHARMGRDRSTYWCPRCQV